MSDKDINTFVQDLQNVGGTIFSCGFIKRTDGSYRKMVARLGVSKGIKGVGMSYDPAKKGLLTVWDMQKKAYRSIPYDGIVLLKSKGKVKLDTHMLNSLGKTSKDQILATL